MKRLKKYFFINELDPILKFTKIILENSNKTIPKTSTNPKKISKPWFNENCKEAIKKRKNAEKQFSLSPSQNNLDNFRILKAKARRTIKQSKRESWKNFVSKLNSHTPMNKVWNTIKKIKGKGSNTHFKHLKVNDNIITDSAEITKNIS